MALKAFATHGFDGAGVRQIAADAGVDPSLIAHQFGSKADLWRAAVDLLSGQLASSIAVARPANDADLGQEQARQALSVAVSHLVDLTCENPLIAKFVMNEIVGQGERSEYVFAKLIRPPHDLLVPLIAAAGGGASRAIDPEVAFFAFNGAIVTAVASRPFLNRMSASAASEVYFRNQLKRAVLAQLLPDVGG
ncbi:MAG: hypothetical protein RIS94_1891 [Pseudomonadota bacterium]|jgi:AcrR family transcriptional regulator